MNRLKPVLQQVLEMSPNYVRTQKNIHSSHCLKSTGHVFAMTEPVFAAFFFTFLPLPN